MPLFNAIDKPRVKAEESDGERNPELDPKLSAGACARRFLRELRGQRRRLCLLVLTGLIASASLLLSPFLISSAIDAAIGQGQVNMPLIHRNALLCVGCFLTSALFSWLMQSLSERVAGEMIRDLGDRAMAAMGRLPLRILDRQAPGDLIARMTSDLSAVNEGVRSLYNQVASGFPSLVAALVLMFVVNARITLMVLVLTPLIFFLTSAITKRSYRYFAKQAEALGAVNASAEENLTQLTLIQDANAEEEREAAFEALNQRLYDCGWRAQFYAALVNPGSRFLNNVSYVLIAVTAAFAALAGGMTVGGMTVILSLSLQFGKPIQEISAVVSQVQNAFAAGARVYALMDAPAESEEEAELGETQGDVRFADVSFAYQKNRPLIQKLNLRVQPGSRIAIVGPTGAGKTTLVNLLMRFYEPDEGRILLDGQPIAAYSRESLRRRLGMVLQEPWIFTGTVYENIAYGRPDAPRAEIEAAARAAMAEPFIRRLPGGYHELLENNGAELSLGQRQLLTIARVFLTSPEILILDEATSAIDTRTELLIQTAFDRLMEGRTSFVIAHRLSTIREADSILVMEKGRIVERGNHMELLRKGGFYAELYRSQYEQLRA